MAETLTKRADFLAANKGLRNARAGFVLLTRPNGGLGVRYGITVTKKIGNAVVRNRMKRRFRELLRAALADQALPNHDHVVIGRAGGVERDFGMMAVELGKALARAHEGKGDPARGYKGRGRRPQRENRSSDFPKKASA
jgi:ribonuclease P protein component